MHRSDKPPWREPASAWREPTSQPELNSGGFSKAHAHGGSERILRVGSPSTRQWNESPRQAEMRLRKAIAGLHTPSPPRGLPAMSPRRPHSALPRTRIVPMNDLQDELGMTRDVLSAAQQQLLNARKSASAARQAEERALTAVLKTRDEARVQVQFACDEAKQQIVSAQARHHNAAPLPSMQSHDLTPGTRLDHPARRRRTKGRWQSCAASCLSSAKASRTSSRPRRHAQHPHPRTPHICTHVWQF